MLGIAGDPQATGKPAGDDIREGKRTVLIAETATRISPAQFEVLAARLGDPDLSDADVAECVEMITASGGLGAVEEFIAAQHAKAAAIVDAWAAAGEADSTDSTAPLSAGTAEVSAASASIRIGSAAQDRLREFAKALSYRTS